MIRCKRIVLISLIPLALGACEAINGGKQKERFYASLAKLPADGNQHHLIVAASTKTGVRVRGFSRAVSPNARIRINASGKEYSALADGLGRFDMAIAYPSQSSVPDSLELIVTGVQPGGTTNTATYRVRNLEKALNSIRGYEVKTKQMPNDLLFLPGRSSPEVLITASGSAAVEHLQLDAGSTQRLGATYFSPANKSSGESAANPWRTVLLDKSGLNAVTTLHGQHSIAHFLIGEKKPHATTRLDDISGKLLQFALPTTIVPRAPVYFSGGASPDAELRSMPAQYPQGMLLQEPWLLVAYTNYIDFADIKNPAQAGPGAVGIFLYDGRHITSKGSLTLPCQNAVDIIEDNRKKVWAVCAGLLGFTSQGSIVATSDAELIELIQGPESNDEPFAQGRRINLGRFWPNSILFVDDVIVIASGLKPMIGILPYEESTLQDSHILHLRDAPMAETLGQALAHYDGGLVLVPAFNSNKLYVLDAHKREINPWPFEQGIPLSGAPSNDSLGPLAIAKRPGRLGIDHHSDDFGVLLAKRPSVLSLSMLRLMGP
jgi:hypothetical protein